MPTDTSEQFISRKHWVRIGYIAAS